MVIPDQVPVPQKLTQVFLIDPEKEGKSWVPVSGIGAGKEQEVVEGVDILA